MNNYSSNELGWGIFPKRGRDDLKRGREISKCGRGFVEGGRDKKRDLRRLERVSLFLFFSTTEDFSVVCKAICEVMTKRIFSVVAFFATTEFFSH